MLLLERENDPTDLLSHQYQTMRSSELFEALRKAREKAETQAKNGTVKAPEPAKKPAAAVVTSPPPPKSNEPKKSTASSSNKNNRSPSIDIDEGKRMNQKVSSSNPSLGIFFFLFFSAFNFDSSDEDVPAPKGTLRDGIQKQRKKMARSINGGDD